MTNNTNSTVADTILEQLGGNRFLAMTGARNLTYDDRALNMRLGRNSEGVTHVRISLSADDTYRLHFMRCRGHNITDLGVVEGVYCDRLRDVFTSRTGLLLSL